MIRIFKKTVGGISDCYLPDGGRAFWCLWHSLESHHRDQPSARLSAACTDTFAYNGVVPRMHYEETPFVCGSPASAPVVCRPICVITLGLKGGNQCQFSAFTGPSDTK